VRILCVSNLYPPVAEGGYELGCADVMRELAGRGHTVRVLTSSRDTASAPHDPHVSRTLPHFFGRDGGLRDLPHRLAAERRSAALLRRGISEIAPDVVYFFNTQGLSRSLLFHAQDAGVPVAVYVSDPWFERWRYDDEWLRLWSAADYAGPKAAVMRALRGRVRIPGVRTEFHDLDLRGVHFTSAALRDAAARAGQPVADAPVVHWGVDPARFTAPARERKAARRLLFVGRVIEAKGVHVAVEALRDAPGRSLTVVGSLADEAYATRLRRMAEGLDVTFAGPRTREQVVEAYAAHDALVLPSVWAEPFSITLLEAMASGLPCVVADTGGSPEIVRDGVNGLLYAATDPAACAAALRRLDDPDLAESLGRQARQDIETTHSLATMVDRVEALLGGLTGAASRGA
jgi:glycosyltransferase involved in cell wall biosynthesis